METVILNDLSVIPRDKHTISRKQINPNALKVLNRLNKNGYDAFLVGGSVRDLLTGKQPKDFDVTTNATPEQVQKLFRNSRLVGRRFRLAHIIFGRDVIEVATFRATSADIKNQHDIKQSHSGMLIRDNVYGTIEEDALRRDFTVNALYYSAQDFTVRDYCNGLKDLQNKTLRLIGDPQIRYREDPVRMLRAIRFSAKLDMKMDDKTASPIKQLNHLLKGVPAARLFDESLKLLQTGNGVQTYHLLQQFHLFSPLFPIVYDAFTPEKNSYMERLIERALHNTDQRLIQGKRINPAFLFTCMLWYPLQERTDKLTMESGLNYYEAFAIACNDILNEQSKTTLISRRISSTIIDIWNLQLRMAKRSRRRTFNVLNHPKFRASYDLLELRASIEQGTLKALAEWWKIFQSVSIDKQEKMIKDLNRKHHKSSTRHAKPRAKMHPEKEEI